MKTLIILGNGPTIIENLSQILELQQQPNTHTIGVNRVFKIKDFQFGEQVCKNLDYYLALDKHTWYKLYKDIRLLKCKKYFISSRYPEVNIEEGSNFFFKLSANVWNFSRTLEDIGHGYTSVYPCMQIGSNYDKVYIFGVDYKKDGEKTHFFGNVSRTPKSWELGKKAVETGLEELRKLNVETHLVSRLYNGS